MNPTMPILAVGWNAIPADPENVYRWIIPSIELLPRADAAQLTINWVPRRVFTAQYDGSVRDARYHVNFVSNPHSGTSADIRTQARHPHP